MHEDELLHWVDEDGNSMMSVRRGDAHGNPELTHLEVGALLLSADGRVLLSQRSAQKARHPGRWELSCCGHVPYEQSGAQAILTELAEELGMRGIALRPVGRSAYRSDYESHVTELFVGPYRGQPLTLQPEEVGDCRLFDLAEAEALGDALHPEFAPLVFLALSGRLPEWLTYRVRG